MRYPILPTIVRARSDDPGCTDCWQEILHIRQHSLITPRDFDLSPYFVIIKPTLHAGFEYRALRWADTESDPPGPDTPTSL